MSRKGGAAEGDGDGNIVPSFPGPPGAAPEGRGFFLDSPFLVLINRVMARLNKKSYFFRYLYSCSGI